jgi:hypothetical protein
MNYIWLFFGQDTLFYLFVIALSDMVNVDTYSKMMINL